MKDEDLKQKIEEWINNESFILKQTQIHDGGYVRISDNKDALVKYLLDLVTQQRNKAKVGEVKKLKRYLVKRSNMPAISYEWIPVPEGVLLAIDDYIQKLQAKGED